MDTRQIINEIDANLDFLHGEITMRLAERANYDPSRRGVLTATDARVMTLASTLTLTYGEVVREEQVRDLLQCLLAVGVADFVREAAPVYALALTQCLELMCRHRMQGWRWDFRESRITAGGVPAQATLSEVWVGRAQVLEGVQNQQEQAEFWTRALRAVEAARDHDDRSRLGGLRAITASRVIKLGLGAADEDLVQAIMSLCHVLPDLRLRSFPEAEALAGQAISEAREAMSSARVLSIELGLPPAFQEFFAPGF